MNTYKLKFVTVDNKSVKIEPKEYLTHLKVRKAFGEVYRILKKRPRYVPDLENVKSFKNALKDRSTGIRKIEAEFSNGYKMQFDHDNITSGLKTYINRQMRYLLDNDKKPCKDGIYMGIEIECYLDGSNSFNSLKTDLTKYAPWVTLGHDGSINCGEDGGYPLEIKIIIEKSESEILKNIMEIINSHNAKVNQSCGMHVHLDFRDSTGRSPLKGYRALYQYLDILYAMQPASRRSNTYCRKNSSPRFSSRGNRYLGINGTALRKFNTLEIRMHSSTTNFTKVWNWCRLLNTIVENGALRKPRNGSINQDVLLNALGSELMHYVQSRIAQFNNSTSALPVEESEVVFGYDPAGNRINRAA